MYRKRITTKHLIFVLLLGSIFYWQATKADLFKGVGLGKTNMEQQNTNETSTASVDEIGLTFEYPAELTFRKEVADNEGRIRNVGFYLEKGSKDNPTYQLYGLYQYDREATEVDLEKTKTGVDSSSIKDASIDGFSGFEGLITGPKSHYTTNILKDGRLFSVSTWPPTKDNKAITDQIVATFDFE